MTTEEGADRVYRVLNHAREQARKKFVVKLGRAPDRVINRLLSGVAYRGRDSQDHCVAGQTFLHGMIFNSCTHIVLAAALDRKAGGREYWSIVTVLTYKEYLGHGARRR